VEFDQPLAAVSQPPRAGLAPRGQAWEMTRYRTYQIQRQAAPSQETLGPAVAFLTLAGINAAPITHASERHARIAGGGCQV
jgi:hypothetical protein